MLWDRDGFRNVLQDELWLFQGELMGGVLCEDDAATGGEIGQLLMAGVEVLAMLGRHALWPYRGGEHRGGYVWEWRPRDRDRRARS
ncbi:hypothetical protein [Bounagaea algeriensis]